MTSSSQWYLDSIEHELADLPADERAELLEDLAAHFSEFATEEDLVATLGDPAAYARELRDAAGLSAGPQSDIHVALIDRVRANVDALRRSTWWRAVAAFLPELRPAWWVLRAWLIVAALAGGIDFPIPRVADRTWVGLAALLLVVPVSVKLGQQAIRGERKGLNVALTVFGALFFVMLPASASDDSDGGSVIIAWPTTTRVGPLTVGPGPTTGLDTWVFDSAGTRYLVRILPGQDGRTEWQALCPSELLRGPARALRTFDGGAIVCVGRLDASASPTLAPSPSTAPATTAAPATTTAPATTSSEASR